MSDDELRRVSGSGRSRIEAAGGDPRAIPEPWQTFVIVETAQAIIDNGGLGYFYEGDFPGKPPYSLFSSAYRTVGAEQVAAIIDRTSQMFPFAEPHLDVVRRTLWLAEIANQDHEFSELSARACGDPSVFKQLSAYVGARRESFDVA